MNFQRTRYLALSVEGAGGTLQEEVDVSSWSLVVRFAFSWPCCPGRQQCMWKDNQWCSALAGHPDHKDPQQVYRLDSIPVTTCLWPSQTGLTSKQASYSLGFLLSLAHSSAWTTCLPEGHFQQPSWHGHHALLVVHALQASSLPTS